MRNLLLTGGPYHDFDRTAPILADLLAAEGIRSEITDDVEAGLAAAAEFDLLTAYLLRWQMLGEMFDADRPAWAFSLSAHGRAAIVEHLARGGGLLALHTAAICFDDWPAWAGIVGARWDWERSSHHPPRPSRVEVCTGAHPIVDGAQGFEVVDEVYSFLDCRPVTPLMTSPRRGIPQPLLWARSVGAARVVYDALGHDERSLTEPTHAGIIRRSARWVAASSRDR